MNNNIAPSVATDQARPASSYNTYVKNNFEALWLWSFPSNEFVYELHRQNKAVGDVR